MMLVLRTEHAELRRIRPWLERAIRGLDPDLIGAIELATHEVAANIVDHGERGEDDAGRVMICVERSPTLIRVQLSDRSAPVALPEDVGLEPHPRVRGYGMLIVEVLASSVRYERIGQLNQWTIDFELGS